MVVSGRVTRKSGREAGSLETSLEVCALTFALEKIVAWLLRRSSRKADCWVPRETLPGGNNGKAWGQRSSEYCHEC